VTEAPVVLTATEGAVRIVTVNRPEKRNALNAAVREALVAALDDAEADPDVRVVVFTGAGEKAFVAGADVSEFAERTPLEQRAAMARPVVFDRVWESPLPTIAMIRGYCLGGGCELALACDLRIGADTARLGQPEIRLGILPGGGATQRLPRLVGYGKALELVLSGMMIDGVEAYEIGLLDRVVPEPELRESAMELAASIAAHSPVALALAKRAIRAAFDLPLSAGLGHERDLFALAFASEDKEEGVRAFLEKRAPQWKGR